MSGLSTRLRRHLRANVVGYVALFIAVAGGTASALPGKNKVNSGDIKAGQVKASDLASDAVSSPKVQDDSLLGADIDESSLDLPAPPTTLPPIGPAGGDLAGTYPDPAVGPDAIGSPEIADESVGFADIEDESVGEAEIDDTLRSIELGAWMVDDSRLGVAGAPSVGSTGAGGFPSLQFDASVDESVTFVTRLPDDLRPTGGGLNLTATWSAPATGTVVWNAELTSVTPGTSETLAQAPQSGMIAPDQSDAANEVERQFLGGVASNSFLPGDLVKIRIIRDANNGSDTLPGDASLLLLTVDFKTTR